MSYNELTTAFDRLRVPLATTSVAHQKSADQLNAAAQVDAGGAVTIDEGALRAAIGDLVPPGDQGQMNSRVASGWQAGAQVHEMGHLVDAAAPEFAGTIRIQP